ncbi:MAG: hemolysin III family protein, partial [Atribacterota bacterium]
MNKKSILKNSFLNQDYGQSQEIINSITHGIGAILSIFGLIMLLYISIQKEDIWRIVSFAIYGATLIFLYISSTIYHSVTDKRKKYIFRILDHIAIYLLIAGSYTPLTLVLLRGPLGWIIFGVVWLIALAGIFMKIFFFNKTKILSMILYIIMGWLIVVATKPIISILPTGILYLLIVGGLCYSIGIIFYIIPKVPYNHTIWHIFVLAGSFTHF